MNITRYTYQLVTSTIVYAEHIVVQFPYLHFFQYLNVCSVLVIVSSLSDVEILNYIFKLTDNIRMIQNLGIFDDNYFIQVYLPFSRVLNLE